MSDDAIPPGLRRRGFRLGVGGLPAPDAMPPIKEISGHPAVIAPNMNDDPVVLTVCAGCGHMRSVLWLSGDRWFCSNCRAEGDARPTMIPIA